MGCKLKVIGFNCGFNGTLVWLYSGAIAGSGYMKFLHHFHLSENFKWKTWGLQPSVVFSASSTRSWIHKSVNGFSHGTPISPWLWLRCANSMSVECLWAGVWGVLVLHGEANADEFSKKKKKKKFSRVFFEN